MPALTCVSSMLQGAVRNMRSGLGRKKTLPERDGPQEPAMGRKSSQSWDASSAQREGQFLQYLQKPNPGTASRKPGQTHPHRKERSSRWRMRRNVRMRIRDIPFSMEDQQTSYAAQCDYYTNYIQSREDWEFVKLYS